MNNALPDLTDQLIDSLFRIKHLIAQLHVEANDGDEKFRLSMAELALMKDIQGNTPDSNNNVCISKIQEHLHITKAGVSKMLGVLEKNGYINRDVDKNDRRNIVVTLTPKGDDAVNNLYRQSGEQFIKLIQHLGEEDTKKFIKYVNKFAAAMKQ